MDEKQFLTPPDLAELLEVPLSTVYKWSADGTGPRRTWVGKHIRYTRDAVNAWIAENTEASE